MSLCEAANWSAAVTPITTSLTGRNDQIPSACVGGKISNLKPNLKKKNNKRTKKKKGKTFRLNEVHSFLIQPGFGR